MKLWIWKCYKINNSTDLLLSRIINVHSLLAFFRLPFSPELFYIFSIWLAKYRTLKQFFCCRMVQKTSKIYKQLEKPVNADVNPPASPEVTHLLNKEKTKEEPKLMFQPAVDIVLPSGFKVILRGLKELPDNFRLRSSNEKDTFSFQLQPSRIIGQSGLLVRY